MSLELPPACLKSNDLEPSEDIHLLLLFSLSSLLCLGLIPLDYFRFL